MGSVKHPIVNLSTRKTVSAEMVQWLLFLPRYGSNFIPIYTQLSGVLGWWPPMQACYWFPGSTTNALWVHKTIQRSSLGHDRLRFSNFLLPLMMRTNMTPCQSICIGLWYEYWIGAACSYHHLICRSCQKKHRVKALHGKMRQLGKFFMYCYTTFITRFSQEHWK
jgi:hypothetical protein